ncbi:T9SS sorting signal type C domain-containing protein [Chishuiella sp.]|uniref:T9SS sorting signal type C domain-containing protein n=1 Tax=Chishuiella sp. TaxID=1969467 RepID=UPI0028B1A114|nr:T9SS sorting signal type C domain-containing protein [Chishuiella sp.]
MKKNLLALFALSGIFSTTYAQDTYINDAVVVKVNPNTLFYNGGAVAVNTTNTTATTEKIINEGNIQIEGNFSNANTTGKNFVNRYISTNSYAQLKINDVGDVTGKITIERPNFDATKGEYYDFGLPFQDDNIEDIINNITGSNSTFKGDCKVNQNCGTNRYNETLLLWDIHETEYDHVPLGSKIIPGSNYIINTRNGEFRNFLINISSSNKFSTYGKPNNKNLILDNIESGIVNKSESQFSELTWGNWKNLLNNYNEKYVSYLGNNVADTNARYGKNLHRFSNPFTSNLDLSDISIDNSWIKFIIDGVVKSPTQTFDPTAIKFKLNKLTSNNSNWNIENGGSNPNITRISVYLQKGTNQSTPYFWAGNPDALIIKPFEYFEIDYYTMIKARNGNSNLVKANFNISDSQKTFENEYKYKNNTTGVYSRNSANNSNEDIIESKGLIAGNDFTQLELSLFNEENSQGDAIYLVNSSFYKTGDNLEESFTYNPIFLHEENKDGSIVLESETLFNQFNSDDYIGKPIKIGFNNLTEGQEYTINLRFFEKSILNKVKNFSTGNYYLLDKVKNNVTEINSESKINFIANSKTYDQYELYWKQKPSLNNINNINSTFIYTDNNYQFVKFEQSNTTADIDVFDLTGRKILSKNAVTTSSDYQLNLNNISSIYVVKITYKNGKTVTKKIIKK